MGTIWVREFIGGLDTRRLPETTAGGVLIKATDGHINRGGEFEKRAAFVREYQLPAGATKGLAAGKSGIVVFGHQAPPVLPTNVFYQRLQHPDGVTALVSVPSYDLHGGKIYAVGEFADGSRYHFFDGVRIPDWYDGRARASFRVVSGAGIPAAFASGSFEVIAGTNSPGVNVISDIKIDGISIIGTAVDHTGNNATTASAIAAEINDTTSSPNYTAVAVGQTVTITAADTGTAANGKSIVVTVGGDAQTGNVQNMAGGAAAVAAQLNNLTVDGVSIITNPVAWATSNSDTAQAIATEINSTTSSPNYTATAVGEVVNIVSEAAGTNANGRIVGFSTQGLFTVDPVTGLSLAGGADPTPAASATGSFTITGGTEDTGNEITNIEIDGVSLISSPVAWETSDTATAAAVASAINSEISTPDYSATSDGAVVTIKAVTPGSGINGASIDVTVGGDVTVGSVQAMAGGADAESTFVPGTFVKTIGSRMHSVSGPNEHFSGIAAPTKWTTDTVGAGFIDMSTQSSGSETLTALGKYQNFVAVFADRVIQIWYFDSDPALNELRQVLNNTGTESPLSVTQFGDSDLFYLDESGLRSLRARDSSNAAATTDIGVPVDTLIVNKLRSFSAEQRQSIAGVIEPTDGRFWLAMNDEIFVFSFFGGAKISAWTTYTPEANVDGQRQPFTVEQIVVFRRKVYIRSGDDIYVYGGLSDEAVYDDTVAEAWLPYLDADMPTKNKMFIGIDAAVEGVWDVYAAMQPTDTAAEDKVATITKTTYNAHKIDSLGTSTHLSLRFRSKGTGRAKLSSVVVHYNGDSDEDK